MPAAAWLLAGALWSGVAEVDVMMWEGGGEHPYTTWLDLDLREASRVPIVGPEGAVVGHQIQLVAERIHIRAQHEVRGLLNCEGTGEEILGHGVVAKIFVPRTGQSIFVDATGFRVPAEGAYQLELPRAFGGFACGTNNKNPRDRRVGIGSGLFRADVEIADVEPRVLEDDGSRMRGSYVLRRARSADGSLKHLVKKEFHVTWDLRREAEQ